MNFFSNFRWGDYPEKLQLPYIAKLIQTGSWFDGKKNLKLQIFPQDVKDFAPEFVMKHSDIFKDLLKPPPDVIQAEKST